MRHKGLMIILDGLGDRPSHELQGATPLEAARTPTFDAWLRNGMSGLMDPLVAGVPVSTHTGTGVLLGLVPKDALNLSRGPVEAAGIGLHMQPGDVAIRCNFATLQEVDRDLEVLDRRAGRIREDTQALANTLRNIPLGQGVMATLRPATHHRSVLRLSGTGLSPAVTDTDPGAGAKSMRVLTSYALNPEDASAAKTADAVNRFVREAYQRLKDHPVNQSRAHHGLPPANGIITRGAGTLRSMHNLIHHVGLSAAVVAGERTVLGLAQLFNFTTVSEPSFSALPDTDLAGKVRASRHALETHDLVFVHVKGPDICAHDFDPLGKKALLERIDQALAELPTEGLVIGVTGDHSTDSGTGRHCGDPLPALLCGPRVRRDDGARYGESDCMRGGLGRVSATTFLFCMLDNMGYMHNYRRADKPFLVT